MTGYLLMVLPLSAGEKSHNTLYLGLPRAKNSPIFDLADKIYRELGRRVGVHFSIRGCVPTRCAEQILQGELDGEVGRIPEYADIHENLVATDTYLLPLLLVAITHAESPALKNWADVLKLQDTVLYHLGYLKTRSMLKDKKNKKDYEYFGQAIQIFNGCKHCLITDLKISHDLASQNLPGVLATPNYVHVIDTVFVGPVFHKKHGELALKVGQALRDIRKEGLIAKMCLDYQKVNPRFYCEQNVAMASP